MLANNGLGHRRVATGFVVLVSLLVLAVASSAGARSGWTKSAVASGLDSPRGLTFLPNGTLLVAEAGHGGDVCRSETDEGRTVNHCIGTSSQISSINLASGAHTPIISGLFSSSGLGVTGADGLAVRGGEILTAMTEAPQLYADWTCAGQPADCTQVLAAARAQAGVLLKVTPAGRGKNVGSVGAFDYAWTQSNHQLSTEVDANPYGVLAMPQGTFVADAGSNTLDFVRPNKQIQILGGIPAPAAGGFPSDGVPTCVAQANGKLYVADLAGRLWTWNGSVKTLPKAHGNGKNGKSTPPAGVPLLTQVTLAAGALHHVTGCTADTAGNLYLVDMWGSPGPPIPAGPRTTQNTGSVVMIAPNGAATTLAGGLNFPNGITRAKDGSLYVSENSTCPNTGPRLPYCASGGSIIHLTP